MFRVLYQEARWQGHSILRSLGYAIFDLKLPDRPIAVDGHPAIVEAEQVPLAPAIRELSIADRR
jgi:hypothetical protein